MTAFLKGAVTVTVFLIVFVLPVRASSPTDLWWNSNESGWGVNVVGQSDTLFLTFFVYGQNGQPLWLVAPDTRFQSRGPGGTGSIYSGPLYQTSGPWLGGTFNPSAVTVTQVGTATFTWLTVPAASLTYSVSGTSVTKSLTRQTWNNNFYVPGKFLGGIVLDRVGCSGASRYESLAQFSVAISGSTIQVSMQPSSGGSCSASGTYVQNGSMGSFDGTGTSCVNGASGSVSFSAIHATSDGINGRISATYPGGCQETGNFGGAWRAE